MSTVTEVLLNLGSTDHGIRSGAEQIVQQARESDLAGFCVALIQELRNESNPEQSRMMAAMVLKNSVALDMRNVEARKQLEMKWKALDGSIRNLVKGEMLQTLGCSARNVRQIASLVIANLARIELPANEWTELIPTLLQAVGTNLQHSEAALVALGYVCEEASNHEDVAFVLQSFGVDILRVILSSMSVPELQNSAVVALRNSMEFMADLMSQEHANAIIEIVCTVVQSTASSTPTRKSAMQCLVLLVENKYTLLAPHMNSIFLLTRHALASRCEAVALQGFLFWIELCNVESEMKAHNNLPQSFALQGAALLCELCFSELVHQEEGQSEDDWNVSIAAGKLLQSLAHCIGDAILPHALPFVYTNVNLPDWRNREAAVLAFGCILDGPDPMNIRDTAAQAVGGLMDYIGDQNEMVADTSGWTLSVVCELLPNIFLYQEPVLARLISIVGPLITGPSSTMSVRASTIINNLAVAYENEDNLQTSALSPYYSNLVTALLQAADNGSDPKMRGGAQEALNALIDAAAADSFQTLRNLMPEILQRLGALVVQCQNHQGDVSELQGHQAMLCGALGATVKKLRGEVVPMMHDIVSVLLQIFAQTSEDLMDEALMVIGSLAHACGPAIEQVIPRVFDHVMAALHRTDSDLCHAAAGVWGDIAGALGERFENYATPVVGNLVLGLRSVNVERDVKVTFVGCLGDIALHLGPSFTNFLAEVMAVIGELSAEAFNLDFAGDADTEEFVYNFAEAVCCTFSSILQAFKGFVDPLRAHLQPIFDVAVRCGTSYYRSEEALEGSVTLIGDICNVLRGAPHDLVRIGVEALRVPQVERILQSGRERGGPLAEKAKWAKTQLTALKRL